MPRMNPPPRSVDERSGPTKHEAAVTQTLGWADEAAASRDFAGALEWLAVIEAVGTPLSDEQLGKRATWALAAGSARWPVGRAGLRARLELDDR